MKFVKLGNYSIRANRIVAVHVWPGERQITVYCGAEEHYVAYYKTQADTREAHDKLMEQLEKIEG